MSNTDSCFKAHFANDVIFEQPGPQTTQDKYRTQLKPMKVKQLRYLVYHLARSYRGPFSKNGQFGRKNFFL